MNELSLQDVMRCEDQEGAPDGFILYMGVDIADTFDNGFMCVVEFPVPHYASDVIDRACREERTFVIQYEWFDAEMSEMHNVPFKWTRIMPVQLLVG